jgi:hypothetical protein
MKNEGILQIHPKTSKLIKISHFLAHARASHSPPVIQLFIYFQIHLIDSEDCSFENRKSALRDGGKISKGKWFIFGKTRDLFPRISANESDFSSYFGISVMKLR